MTRPLLSVHMPLHRAVEFDYPWGVAIRSVLPAADEVHLIVDPRSEDGTPLAVRLFQQKYSQPLKPIVVHEREWWNPERRSECLADATNFGIEQCRGKYHLALQADEVLHESQLRTLRGIAENGVWKWVEFGRLNFWGTFDMVDGKTRWPISVVRMAKRDCYPIIRSIGDATHLGITDPVDGREYPRFDARQFVQLWHYAYVRKLPAMFRRHEAMANLYGLSSDPAWVRAEANGGFDWWATLVEGGTKMEPDELSRGAAEERRHFLPVPGQHPSVMKEWIEARRPLMMSEADTCGSC